MNIGVSTSCYYPLETELALERVCALGVDRAEVFLNTVSEFDRGYLRELRSMADSAGVAINAVHPFLCFGESYLLFSGYERRFFDTLALCRRFFEAMAELGADIFTIHGEKQPFMIDEELYFKRFGLLCEEGRRWGVRVAQENVVRFRSESPDFLGRMRDALGGNFCMTLDVKQARRSGLSALDLARCFAGSIVDVHLSDHAGDRTCLIPGRGEFDFASLFDIMNSAGYKGNYIVELYRSDWSEDAELAAGVEYLRRTAKVTE